MGGYLLHLRLRYLPEVAAAGTEKAANGSGSENGKGVFHCTMAYLDYTQAYP